MLRSVPEKVAAGMGTVLLVVAAVLPGVLGYPVWLGPAWVLVIVGMTVLGWGHLLLWTTWRALREIPESLARSLLVALLLWATGGVVCVATVSQHVREVLTGVDEEQPLRVRLNIRWNAASVHLAQASVFGLLVFVCFLVFGLLAVPRDTITAWTGAPAALIQLGPVAVSGALVKVSWVLGGFASLYMATTASGDRGRREQHLGPVMAEITGALGPR